jgi:hypothetical protein
MDQQKLTGILDRHYGGKRLGDMTMEEVEQALRDARNKVRQIERDALNDAKIQTRGMQDDDAEEVIRDLFTSRGVADAAADMFLLKKIVEEFSKPSAFGLGGPPLEALFVYWRDEVEAGAPEPKRKGEA